MYHWEFEEPATSQAADLPGGVLALLEEFLTAMCFDPWEYRREPGEVVEKKRICGICRSATGGWSLS